MVTSRILVTLVGAALVLLEGNAVAGEGARNADERPVQYALLIGSNSGGPGQTELRWAEDDTRKVNELLTELSDYSQRNVTRLIRPTPAQVSEAIAVLARRIAADQIAGRTSSVFFYYSGHAKANALNLGDQELAVETLRSKLAQLPAKLTVVVLDACQSGAFSRVKGASPAADFSINSRNQLSANGMVVMASSTGSELSQESETLRSSYFTHHLLVGLRGSADGNRDGKVSVDEAYRYAYNQTLLSTAHTAVGGQHVTLEVDLKGHGEVALSYPAPQTAKLELRASLGGKAIVEHVRSRSVVAEVAKAKGAPVLIAVAPGDYRVILRDAGKVTTCSLSAVANQATAVDGGRCTTAEELATVAKGGDGALRIARPYTLTASFLAGGERGDSFIQNLRDFEYKNDSLLNSGSARGFALAALKRIDRHLSVGGTIDWNDSSTWSRDTDLAPLRFSWQTGVIGALAVADTSLASSGAAARIRPYVLAGAGIGVGRTLFRDADNREVIERHFGWGITGGAGVLFDAHPRIALLEPLTFGLGYRFVYAPIVTNLVGDTHASGGNRFEFSIGYRF